MEVAGLGVWNESREDPGILLSMGHLIKSLTK